MRGVWIPKWVLVEFGATPVAIFTGALIYRCAGNADAVIVRPDADWAEFGLTRRQVQRARACLIERGWLCVDVRQWEGTPMAHLTLLDRLHREVQTSDETGQSSSISKKSENRRRGRRGDPLPNQRGFWPTPIADPVLTDARGTFLPGTGWIEEVG